MIKAAILEKNGDLRIYEGIDLFVKKNSENDVLDRIVWLGCENKKLIVPFGAKAYFFKSAVANVNAGGASTPVDVAETIGYIEEDGRKVEYVCELCEL